MRTELTSFEVKRHGLSDDPPNDDQEWSNEEGDLNAGANGDTHSQIHLVPYSHNNCSDVLGRISNDWDKDKTNEGLADTSTLHNIINTSNEIIGADRNEDGSKHEDTGGCDGADAGLLGFGMLFTSLALGIEKVAVSAELEDEIHDVEKQENNGSSTR